MTQTHRTILCFGDSNTHGSIPIRSFDDRGRLAPADRWPGVMLTALKDEWRLVEEGLPGRTTVHDDPIEGVHKNGLAALPMALESHYPADAVVIALGTNDLKNRFSVTAIDIARSVARLTDLVRASNASPLNGAPRVLLVAPPPIRETGCLAGIFAGGATKSVDLGANYATVAKERGVGFLDAGRVIECSSVDGIHFEPDAHEALGRAAAAAMEDLFEC